MAPGDIERRSMEIITGRLGEVSYSPDELSVVKRVIHTTADFDFASSLVFSTDATGHFRSLAGSDAVIVTDTNMTLAGVNRSALSKTGCEICCFMADEDVAKEAGERGVTRAAVSMEKAAGLKKKKIFAIGNAPTALLKLASLTEAGSLRPAFVIGVCVGFVNVVYSKNEIKRVCDERGIPYIIAEGNKGGSTVAAAILNALLYGCLRH
jgi:precorrin-8X/cobalt-precorrin-8 methylmutase